MRPDPHPGPPGLPPLAVTTSNRPPPALESEARAEARRLGIPFLVRGAHTVERLLTTGAQALIVFARERITLLDPEGELPFHAGMAELRMQRLRRGERDTLVELAGLAAGDAVLDCTLGLGQDAQVAALAVGPTGRVTALEHSLPLFALFDAGVRRQGPNPGSCEVEAIHAESGAWLRACADKQFDVVLFDPMFEIPKKSQPGFALLRRHAEHAPLTPETLEQARRVARRRVVLKAGKHGRALQQLGLQPLQLSRYSDLAWCVLEA